MKNVVMQKNTICLWYSNEAVEAAHFYANTFPGSLVGKVFQATKTTAQECDATAEY